MDGQEINSACHLTVHRKNTSVIILENILNNSEEVFRQDAIRLQKMINEQELESDSTIYNDIITNDIIEDKVGEQDTIEESLPLGYDIIRKVDVDDECFNGEAPARKPLRKKRKLERWIVKDEQNLKQDKSNIDESADNEANKENDHTILTTEDTVDM